MGILGSRIDFNFSCSGLLMWREAGFGRAESAVDLMEAVFPAARGCQGAKLAGGDAHGAPLTAPSRRKSYEHESEGAAVGRRVCADRVDFSVSSVSPLVVRILRSWAEPFQAFWSIAGTISHSVVAFQRPHPDSAFAGGRLGKASPLFATAFQAQQSIGSPTRIDRG